MSKTSQYNHHRRSVRLRGYDYAQPGAYFVTVCAWQRACVFGEIVDGTMRLNDDGRIVEEEWLRTAEVRPNVSLDAWVVMPNHFHGILIISEPRRGVLQYAPTHRSLRSPSQTIGAIVRGFKGATTKRINALRGTSGTRIWQRNYYEHIIRNEVDLAWIREYIVQNPLRWELDQLHPDNPSQW